MKKTLAPVLVTAAICAAPAAALAEDDPSSHLRGVRYCEILPVYRDGLSLHVGVYNTIGHSDCPAAVWDAIDADTLAKEIDAEEVILNGPRYFVMDRIIAEGATKDGETRELGGLTMTERATLSLPLRDLIFGSRPYSDRTVMRDTTYVYDAGKPVYEITDRDGSVYVMQTFSQMLDSDLDMEDLPDIGSRLDLPRGWSYASRVLDEEMRLTASGTATVIQDDLENTYQRRD